MNPTSKRLLGLILALLFLHTTDARAGLIELIETNSGGQLMLSIEGNALRLTDTVGGPGTLSVLSILGSGVPTAEELGFAGEWSSLTVLGSPLQDDVLLPTTRLDSLLGGAGISTSDNTLRELAVIDSSGVLHTFDIDLVEVIGGPVPEPGTFIFLLFCVPSLLNRRKWAL